MADKVPAAAAQTVTPPHRGPRRPLLACLAAQVLDPDCEVDDLDKHVFDRMARAVEAT
jgi:hypothetical protein